MDPATRYTLWLNTTGIIKILMFDVSLHNNSFPYKDTTALPVNDATELRICVSLCRAGAGRSGTFVSCFNMCEQLQREQAVDVFNIVQRQRNVRPQLVETLVSSVRILTRVGVFVHRNTHTLNLSCWYTIVSFFIRL